MKIPVFLICISAIILGLPLIIQGQLWTDTESVSVTVEVPGTSTPPVRPPGGGPGGPWPSETAQALFKGKGAPNSFVTVTQNDQVAGTFRISADGAFEYRLVVLHGGVYDFGLWAEDSQGLKTDTLKFTVELLANRTTEISGIFFPPTLEIKPLSAVRGETIIFQGSCFPNSNVYLLFSDNAFWHLLKSDSLGNWRYQINSNRWSVGQYQVRAKAQDVYGQQSPFTNPLVFSVLKEKPIKPPVKPSECHGADFNNDGRVDLVDFSILLYYWEKQPVENICVDLNNDGKVDLVDFSILLYYWTD